MDLAPAPRVVEHGLTWRGVVSSPDNLSSYTLSSVDIGTQQVMAFIVFVRGVEGSFSPATVTVDGVTVTPQFTHNNDDAANNLMHGYVVEGLTGPVDVVITLDRDALRCALAVWSLDAAPTTVASGSAKGTQFPLSADLLGVTVAAMYAADAGDYIVMPSGVARDMASIEGGNFLTASDDTVTLGETSLDTTGPPPAYQSLAYMTFAFSAVGTPRVTNLSLGGVVPDELYVGATPVQEVYLGSTKVWEPL